MNLHAPGFWFFGGLALVGHGLIGIVTKEFKDFSETGIWIGDSPEPLYGRAAIVRGGMFVAIGTVMMGVGVWQWW